MPFPCGQAWTGSTRGSHSPSIRSIDWNRTDDEGDAVVASAAGIVTTADSTSTRSYGHTSVIDHGNGETHGLRATWTRSPSPLGQTSTRARMLGTVGNTGNSHGAHLHFEERQGKSVIAAVVRRRALRLRQPRPRPTASTSRIAGNFPATPIAEVAVYRRGKKSTFVVNDPAGAAGAAVRQRDRRAGRRATGTATAGSTSASARAKTAKFRLQTPAGIVKVVFGMPSDRRDRRRLGRRRHRRGRRLPRRRPACSTCGRPTARRPPVLLGDADDLPVTGDWDGNGVTDVGVFDQATATFTLRLVDADGQVLDGAGPARRGRRPAGHRRLGRRRRSPTSASGPRHGDLHPGPGVFRGRRCRHCRSPSRDTSQLGCCEVDDLITVRTDPPIG